MRAKPRVKTSIKYSKIIGLSVSYGFMAKLSTEFKETWHEDNLIL